jgi:hypothetical protein
MYPGPCEPVKDAARLLRSQSPRGQGLELDGKAVVADAVGHDARVLEPLDAKAGQRGLERDPLSQAYAPAPGTRAHDRLTGLRPPPPSEGREHSYRYHCARPGPAPPRQDHPFGATRPIRPQARRSGPSLEGPDRVERERLLMEDGVPPAAGGRVDGNRGHVADSHRERVARAGIEDRHHHEAG